MSFELSQIEYSHSRSTWWGTDRVYAACITKYGSRPLTGVQANR